MGIVPCFKNYLRVVSSRRLLVVFDSNPPSGVYSEEAMESFYVDVVSYTQSENTQSFCIYGSSAKPVVFHHAACFGGGSYSIK